jgi:hypothetical protein
MEGQTIQCQWLQGKTMIYKTLNRKQTLSNTYIFPPHPTPKKKQQQKRVDLHYRVHHNQTYKF